VKAITCDASAVEGALAVLRGETHLAELVAPYIPTDAIVEFYRRAVSGESMNTLYRDRATIAPLLMGTMEEYQRGELIDALREAITWTMEDMTFEEVLRRNAGWYVALVSKFLNDYCRSIRDWQEWRRDNDLIRALSAEDADKWGY
jgi:hypothetical protein